MDNYNKMLDAREARDNCRESAYLFFAMSVLMFIFFHNVTIWPAFALSLCSGVFAFRSSVWDARSHRIQDE